MKNQIVTTFILLFAISIFIVTDRGVEQKGAQGKETNVEIADRKVNIFKWTTSKKYRRAYLRAIQKNKKELQ